MKYLVPVLLFVFLAPLCMVAGLFGSCIFTMAFEGATGGNASGNWEMIPMFAGPVIGLAGSVALVAMITRNMRQS